MIGSAIRRRDAALIKMAAPMQNIRMANAISRYCRARCPISANRADRQTNPMDWL
jgi:hypothetical protein